MRPIRRIAKPLDLVGELDRFAAEVLALPGISRVNPHVFVEEKSELAGRMISRAAELRGTGAAARPHIVGCSP